MAYFSGGVKTCSGFIPADIHLASLLRNRKVWPRVYKKNKKWHRLGSRAWIRNVISYVL